MASTSKTGEPPEKVPKKEIMKKVFNDPIHGHIELHPILVKIIDTPQFQRLRNIRQLGGCYHVYPGACHNRFEHSIGVCHLAGQWLRSMRENQPELKRLISDNDILCVEIAGLCHDMGHGPFSHAFDGMFIPNFKENLGFKWKHEQGSLNMIEHMLEENEDLKKDLEKQFGSLEEYDTNIKSFIPELIRPKDKSDTSIEWEYEGRPEEQSFLYEIVSNKETGVDVDKWDYFARDAYHLGMKNSFDHLRFMKFSRVIKADEDGRNHICMRDKESDNVYDMFYTRYCLHRRAYQHKTSNIIEMMITEAMLKANDHLKIKGVKMSDTVKKENMDAYTLLTDNVYYQILQSTDEKMKEAKDILENVEKRNIYKFVDTAIYENQDDKTKDEKTKDEKTKDEIKKEIAGGSLNQEDIEVELVTFDYGMKDKDPIKNMFFFKKEELNKAIKLPESKVSHFNPMVFTEKHLRVYSKKTDKKSVEKVRDCYNAWFKKNRHLFKVKDDTPKE